MSITWDYFPNSRGLVSGILVCGLGFGNFLFNSISTLIMNPNNEKPVHDFEDDEDYYSIEIG